MKTIYIRQVPDELHRAFKVQCAKEDISINKKVIQLISEYMMRVQESRKE